MRRLLLFCLVAVGCSSTPREDGWTPFHDPGNRHHPERVSEIDVVHYLLRLKVDPSSGVTEGTTEITFALRGEADSVSLDAADMTIHSVTEGARPVEFRHDRETLKLRMTGPSDVRPRTVTIRYVGRPTRGLHFVRPDAGYPDKPTMVWSQGETEYSHYWFPCYDYPNDRATSETYFTVPSKFGVISNGRLVDRSEQDGWTTTHWKQEVDHPSYLTSVVIAELDSVADRWRDIPVGYHVPKGMYAESDVRRSLGATPDMLEFYSTKIGTPYPYAKYDQTAVVDFTWGGMENISATTLHQWAVFPERVAAETSSEGLVAHELAHQWFGDLLTCRSWDHIWLNEGFATYFEWLWTEHRYGRDRMREEMKGDSGWYFEEDGNYRRPTVCAVFTHPDDLFDAHTYPRGGWILHMLRDLLGDEKWWKGIANYVRKHARTVVATKDFLAAMEEATGEELDWFFDQWLYHIGYPEFVVSHRSENGKLLLTVEQKQQATRMSCGPLETGVPEVFRVPVEIAVDGKVHRLWIDERREEFEFPSAGWVSFDAKGSILKKVTWKKSPEECIEQLRNDPEAIGRIWAAEQLGVKDAADGVVATLLATEGDSSVEVRRTAMRSLGKIGTPTAIGGLVKYADREVTKEPRVRQVILETLGEVAEREEVRALLRKAVEEETTPGNQSAALVSLGQAGNTSFEEILAYLEKHASDPYLAPGALKALAKTGDVKAIPVLLEYVKYGKHPWVRRRTLQQLSEKKSDDRVFATLLELVDDPWIWIRETSIDALGESGDARALPKLEARLPKEPDGRIRKSVEKAIQAIREAVDRAKEKG